jgi:hypothetical protein
MTMTIEPLEADAATDRDALERCMQLAMLDESQKHQLESKLKDESWHDVAVFAAYYVQGYCLRLRPWELPPCAVSDNPEEESQAQQGAVKLLNKMLAAGLSRYEPDPLNALAMRTKRQR